MVHVLRSREPACRALVGSPEVSTLLASPYRDRAAVWALELDRVVPRWYVPSARDAFRQLQRLTHQTTST